MNAAITSTPMIAEAERTTGLTAAARTAPKASRSVSVGYLRAFVTVLVVAHHAVLAYYPFAPPRPASLLAQPRWWQAFPVIDAQRWTGFALFVGFNDVFFMSLMFLLSGLFVWNSLRRKGAQTFLRDRALRLGVPFALAAALIAPIAYYPAYLQTGGVGLAGFWKIWRSLGNWPAGPAWFVWVLLAFDAIAAGLLLIAPKWGESLGRILSRVSHRPIAFFAVLVAASAAVYLPMVAKFGSFDWTSAGPFFFQTSRIFHYLIYFLIGAGLGACGLDSGLLAPQGKLARRWYLWAGSALLLFGVAIVATIAAVSSPNSHLPWELIGGCAFVLSCAASSLAFLALFVRFARNRVKLFDSLSDNAYGIYLIHYAFVSWLQYALLKASLPGVAKGFIAFAGALALSWISIAALKRIPAVARVI